MGGRGFPPAAGRTTNRNRNDVRSVVKSDGKLGGPVLPDGVLGTDDDGNAVPWHPATVAWWRGWRASPQALRMMTVPDWDFLLDTARLHHEYWTAPTSALAGEVRLRVAKFGATPEDRARLRFDVEPLAEGTDVRTHATVYEAERRNRLMEPAEGIVSPNIG
jgi:hypothetical protein